jgi:hypothetical protein
MLGAGKGGYSFFPNIIPIIAIIRGIKRSQNSFDSRILLTKEDLYLLQV